MKKLFTPAILIILILMLATFLRLWQLGAVPAGVHSDETGYGYNAYSLLLTGKDQHGQLFPLVLPSWGDYKPILYAYLMIPWIALFDLTPFAIRITSAIFGIASVILFYFVTKKLLNNQKIALLAAFLLAISPWHLNFSRTIGEVTVSLFFILLLIFSLLSLQEKFNLKWGLIALFSGILAMGSYTASRFFVILITLIFTLICTQIKNKRIKPWYPGLILILVFVVLGGALSFLDAGSRFRQINVFSSPATKLILEEQIREDQGINPLFTRIMHNKIINYSQTILTNYSQYFTMEYLFLDGGYPKRFRLPDQGLFYLWQLPFLITGIYVLLRKKSRKSVFLLGWWGVLLLPASITTDEIPNVQRTLVVVFPMLIIIAVGLYELFSYRLLHKLKIPILILLALVGLWEFAYYQHQYYRHQEVHQPWYRDYAYEPLMQSLQTLAPKYEKIVVTKSQQNADIGVLFWGKYDPKTYQAEGSPRDADYKGFGKYIFDPNNCPSEKFIRYSQPGVLFVNKGDCPLPERNVRLLKTINWQDDNPAFQLVEYIATPSSSKK